MPTVTRGGEFELGAWLRRKNKEKGPVVLVLEVPFWDQESRSGSRIKDPNWEVAQPSGGIGGLHEL
jgi:hypothetical protein